MDDHAKPVKDQLDRLRAELDEMEAHLPRWNADNLAGAKIPRSIAQRIVLSAKRLEVLVKENTFSPYA
jgi:hypothetical protein